MREGDRQAPEGSYTITPELMIPNSNFYLSINLGYANSFDKANERNGKRPLTATAAPLAARPVGPCGAHDLYPIDRNGLVNALQSKRRDARVQNGGTPVIDSGKATVDRRVKLNRINDFLAIAAEGRCNIGKAPALTLPA